jgi:hypothetical protein
MNQPLPPPGQPALPPLAPRWSPKKSGLLAVGIFGGIVALGVANLGQDHDTNHGGGGGTPTENARLIVEGWPFDFTDCRLLTVGHAVFVSETIKNVEAKGHDKRTSEIAAEGLWSKISAGCR